MTIKKKHVVLSCTFFKVVFFAVSFILMLTQLLAQPRFIPPAIINADAPDSVTFPVKAESFFYHGNPILDNDIIKIVPPQKNPLHALKDSKGSYVRDSLGHFFILGEGGTADFTNYNSDKGLPIDGVYCSFMDHHGNFWFGTGGGGVCKFDGQEFITYNNAHGLADNAVMSICEGKDGKIWLATLKGLSVFDGRSFKNYTTKDGLTDNHVLSVYSDKSGIIWAGTSDGVTSINKGIVKSFKVGNYQLKHDIRSIIQDKAGNIWFGANGGISKYDGKKVSFVPQLQKRLESVIISICEDVNGNVWFGTPNGLYCYHSDSNIVQYTTKDGLINNAVQCVYEDKKHNIWIGTYGGVSCFDGKIFTNYTETEGLANKSVNSIAEDYNGNLWFATYTGGVSRFNGKAFTNYTKSFGLLPESLIFSIYKDDQNTLWLGTYNGGVVALKDKRNSIEEPGFTTYNIYQGLVDVTVRSIYQDSKGNLWFGANGGGLSRFNGKTFYNYNIYQGLPSGVIVSIVEDKNGYLWFATEDEGIFRFDGKTIISYTQKNGLVDNNVRCLIIDKKNNLWVGTGKGISLFNKHANGTNGQSYFVNYTLTKKNSGNSIHCLFEDPAGNIWVGTDGGGLFRYDGNSFLNFNQQDGLPDDVVTQVVMANVTDSKDKNNMSLVVGTNLGLGVITGWTNKAGDFISFNKSLHTLSNKGLKDMSPVFKIFNTSTGYPVKDVNIGQNTIYKDNDGILWIATGSDKTGLVRFAPQELNHNPNPLELTIKKIKINEEDISWYQLLANKLQYKGKYNDSLILLQKLVETASWERKPSRNQYKSMVLKYANVEFDSLERNYPVPVNLVLPYEHNNITIEFNAIEVAKNNLVNYQYILEGYNEEWSPLSEKTSATFGNIAEGIYTFKLKCISPDGVCTNSLSYTFTVLPPAYRTWWAYLLYILFFVSSLWGVFKWRTSALRKEKERLEQTVIERTSEIVKQNIELEKLSIVASKTDNGVVICGPAGELEWLNDGFTRMLGYTLGELKKQGNTIAEVSHNKNIDYILEQCITTKKSVSYQSLNHAKDGTQLWVQSLLTPILDDAGVVKKLVLIDTDITERKLSEDEIKFKNQKITDSINYALRIQQAILPTQEIVNKYLPESFVFFKPKDIVSGDFYWAHSISENVVLYAAVDCTGHGVPGALMSIMSYNLIEQIVKEQKIYEPALILNKLSNAVVKALKQTDEIGSVKEGMDIALCKIDYNNLELEYAGAHNPLHIVRNGELIEVKANRRSIGISPFNDSPFVNHKIQLIKGDCIYVFTDGYADQKGGPDNEKFYYQPFRQLLVDIHQLNMVEQAQELEFVMNDWQGFNEQIDDMLIIGIKI